MVADENKSQSSSRYFLILRCPPVYQSLNSRPNTPAKTAGYSSSPSSVDRRFGQDFDLLKDEFKTRSVGGGTYWLPYLKPKRAGYFYLQHKYREHGGYYSHIEQEIRVGVGPQGCYRGLPFAATYSRICLGDTIIFPVNINDFTHHQFKLIKAEYSSAGRDWQTFDDPHPELRGQGFDQTPITNPLAEFLRYLGCYSVKAALAYPGYTVQWYAVFEAMKPGRFNLEVTAAAPVNTSTSATSSTQPIIVIAQGAPVTMLVAREELRFFSRRKHGQEWLESSSGNSYVTDLRVLQPGDRIPLGYYSFTRKLEFAKRPGAGLELADPADIKPVISLHPFSFEVDHEFNEWLIDQLPG